MIFMWLGRISSCSCLTDSLGSSERGKAEICQGEAHKASRKMEWPSLQYYDSIDLGGGNYLSHLPQISISVVEGDWER